MTGTRRGSTWIAEAPHTAVSTRIESPAEPMIVSRPDLLPHDPFDLSDGGWVVSCVVGIEERAAVLAAAARGVDLLLSLELTEPERAAFIDELSRISDVSELRDQNSATIGPITDEHRRLLGLLESGSTVGAASRSIGMSRRTAHRRILEIHELLGVSSTAVAVVRARELGLLPPTKAT